MRTTRTTAIISTAMVVSSLLWAVPARAQQGTVTVTPAIGVAGGDLVELSGTGWPAEVRVEFCQGAVPAVGEPQNSMLCDNGDDGGFVITDAQGEFTTTVRLRRFIYPPARGSWVDCTDPGPDGPASCFIGAAEPGSVGTTGTGVPVEFAPDPPDPAQRGTISYAPVWGVAPGGTITVNGDGFGAGAVVELYQCLPGATDPSTCDQIDGPPFAGPPIVVADGSGSFSTGFVVDQLVDPPGAPPAVDCILSTCVVVAAEAADFPGTVVEDVLHFPSVLPRVVPGVGAVDEGDAGSVPVEIPVSLSKPSSDEVTVVVDTFFVDQGSPIEAEPGSDYDPVSSQPVTFAPGETEPTVPVTVTINGDVLFEPGELFLVWFHDPTNAVIGGFYGLGFGVILNDDAAPVIEPGTVEVPEGTGSDTVANVPVSLTGPSAEEITVEWNTVELEGTPLAATAGVDYEVPSEFPTVTFPPGTTEATVPVTIKGDASPETDELVVVEFHDPVGAPLGGFFGLGFVAILDDDGAGPPP